MTRNWNGTSHSPVRLHRCFEYDAICAFAMLLWLDVFIMKTCECHAKPSKLISPVCLCMLSFFCGRQISVMPVKFGCYITQSCETLSLF